LLSDTFFPSEDVLLGGHVVLALEEAEKASDYLAAEGVSAQVVEGGLVVAVAEIPVD
jgi:hypothetical protein